VGRTGCFVCTRWASSDGSIALLVRRTWEEGVGPGRCGWWVWFESWRRAGDERGSRLGRGLGWCLRRRLAGGGLARGGVAPLESACLHDDLDPRS